jgi:hypothetical protein
VNVTSIRSRGPYKTILLLGVSALLLVITMVGAVSGMEGSGTATRQAEVATHGAQVMPFDLEQTMHVFQSLNDGGLQTVRAKDPANREQIALIQAHLKEEAERVSTRDFSARPRFMVRRCPGWPS